MRDTDFPQFAAMLDDVAGLKREVYSPGQKTMFFRALSAHSLDAVRAGLDAHVKHPKNGRFLPMPADVIGQIESLVADDGRPGPEEAFAVALRAADERDSVVWSQESAKAWAIALPIFCGGDQVGARMAFKEAYNRLVDEARRARQPVQFLVSEGFEPERRRVAIEAAVVAGLLPQPDPALALLALPAPRADVLAVFETAPPEQRERLIALRARLLGTVETESRDALSKQRTERLRREAAERVADYEQQT